MIDNLSFELSNSQVTVWLPTEQADRPIQLQAPQSSVRVAHPAARQFEYAVLMDVQQAEVVSEPVRLWEVAGPLRHKAAPHSSSSSKVKRKERGSKRKRS